VTLVKYFSAIVDYFSSMAIVEACICMHYLGSSQYLDCASAPSFFINYKIWEPYFALSVRGVRAETRFNPRKLLLLYRLSRKVIQCQLEMKWHVFRAQCR